eukprot:GFUD01085051.1.p1 GENE.GFUD01085051.1~~GFUD01085051.1.p1  ORF type:complete len:130 (+),score=36.00 GFUD01085051.1:56-391(+)
MDDDSCSKVSDKNDIESTGNFLTIGNGSSGAGFVARRRSIFDIEDQDKLKKIEPIDPENDTVVILTNVEKQEMDAKAKADNNIIDTVTDVKRNQNGLRRKGLVAQRRAMFE